MITSKSWIGRLRLSFLFSYHLRHWQLWTAQIRNFTGRHKINISGGKMLFGAALGALAVAILSNR